MTVKDMTVSVPFWLITLHFYQSRAKTLLLNTFRLRRLKNELVECSIVKAFTACSFHFLRIWFNFHVPTCWRSLTDFFPLIKIYLIASLYARGNLDHNRGDISIDFKQKFKKKLQRFSHMKIKKNFDVVPQKEKVLN